MAAATLTPSFTVISTCEATTGWNGTNTVDTEIFKQGTASLSGTLRTVGANLRYFTGTARDLRNTHIRLWLNFSAIKYLSTKATGGIRILVDDGAATAYWYVGGIDTYDGGWVLLTVDTAKALDSNPGNVNLAAITRIGFALNLTAAPRNAVNTWWDYVVIGNGIAITGGTNVDPVTWDTIAAADSTGGYGAVRKVNSVFFVNTNLVFGGASQLYFEDSNQIVVFEDQPVNADLYKLSAVATSTLSWKLTNSVIKSAATGTRYDLLLDDASLGTLTFSGNTLASADVIKFKTGQTVTGCTFQNCNRVEPSLATFTNNTIRNSVGTAGAVLVVPSHGISSCIFQNNSIATEISSTGTYTYPSLTFSGNTYDVNNTSGSSVTINSTGGSNVSTYTGSAVVVNNSVNITISSTVSLVGAEIRIYDMNGSPGYLGTELAGTESNPTSSFSFATNGGNIVWVQVMLSGYEEFGLLYTTPSVDTALPITLKTETNV